MPVQELGVERRSRDEPHGSSQAVDTASPALRSSPSSELALPSLERPTFLQSIFGTRSTPEMLPLPATDTSEAAYRAMCDRCSDPTWLRHKGPAYSVLRMQSDFITPPFQQVHAVPEQEFIASNYTPDEATEELYYVPGMCYGPDAIEQHLSSLVKTFGKPVTAIINDQEGDLNEPMKPGFLKSVWHATCGFLSPSAGHAVEPDAIERVEHAIKEHVESGKPLHLIAHSQGSIIVGNALDRMLAHDSPLSAEEKEKMKALVRVSTFGAAEHYFPSGIRVQEYAHRGDLVKNTTSVLADAREVGRSIVGSVADFSISVFRAGASLLGIESAPPPSAPERVKAPVVYLDGDHDFGPFLDKLPEFFIRQAGGERVEGGVLVAQALTHSIASARLSDLMHGLIIREMIHRGDRAFAQAFLAANPAGVNGSFKAPFLAELRALAGE